MLTQEQIDTSVGSTRDGRLIYLLCTHCWELLRSC